MDEWQWLLRLILFLGLAFVIVNLKASRGDGTPVRRVHPYRKVVYSLNRTKSHSQVQMEYRMNAEPLLDFIRRYNQQSNTHLTVHLCVIAAVNHALANNPEMDRFVMAGRLYQRKQRSISFTVKKEKGDRRAALGTVKLAMRDGESFESLIQRISDAIERERQPKPTAVDQEMALLNRLPPAAFKLALTAASWLNNHNSIPESLLRSDVMHTSAFIANLGSLGIPAAYHHLYEWGTCPVFLTLGEIEDMPMAEDGQLVVRKTLQGKFSFDERIADGLTAWQTISSGLQTLERPEHFFATLKKPISEPAGEPL